MINGIRILLEQRGDFVLVKIDLRNAYNEIDRGRRFSACLPLSAHLGDIPYPAPAAARPNVRGLGGGRQVLNAPPGPTCT